MCSAIMASGNAVEEALGELRRPGHFRGRTLALSCQLVTCVLLDVSRSSPTGWELTSNETEHLGIYLESYIT